MNKKVLLGMSGGVDSSVSAILLKKQGYEVIGATMRLWEESSTKLDKKIEENKKDKNYNDNDNMIQNQVSETIKDAKKVCQKLGIEHHVIDLREEFKKRVVDNFMCSYMCAKTPNPCVECNKFIKFDSFYKYAKKIGCEYIATGHYAKIKYSERYKQYVLAKANAERKDQTYFLYGINREILPYIIFPLAEFTDKEEIRKIAEENSLDVARKKDSQEICFIQNKDYAKFIKENNIIEAKTIHKMEIYDKVKQNNSNNNTKSSKSDESGNIVLKTGEVLGKHTGLINYTVGQRKGLGVSYKEPLYVLKLDGEKSQVIVGTEQELYSKELNANELNFLIENIDFSKPVEVKAKIRYRAKEAKAVLEVADNNVAKVKFKEPQRAITPGQSVVFYIDDILLGGGKIL